MMGYMIPFGKKAKKKTNFYSALYIHKSQMGIERIKAWILPLCICNIKNKATKSFDKLSTNIWFMVLVHFNSVYATANMLLYEYESLV